MQTITYSYVQSRAALPTPFNPWSGSIDTSRNQIWEEDITAFRP